MSLRALCGDTFFNLSNKREQASKEKLEEPLHSTVEMTGGAYLRLGANSRLGTNSNKYDVVFFLFAFICVLRVIELSLKCSFTVSFCSIGIYLLNVFSLLLP